jgi:predicted PurR-regulated permease PerM
MNEIEKVIVKGNPPPEKNFIKNLLIICGLITLIILLTIGASYVIDILMMTFAAILLAILLNGLGNLLRRFVNVSESTSVLLVSALLLLVFGGIIALLAPDVGDQYKHLRDELPKSFEQVRTYLSQYGWGRTLIENIPTSDEIIDKINNSGFLTRVGNYFSSTLGILTNIALVMLVSLYLATEPETYKNGLTQLFPFGARPRVREVLTAIGTTMQSWLVGKFASMAFIGVLTVIGLWILGVPLALLLGIIAGLFSFIPNFGPILSAVPAILLAFIESPIKAGYVVILFVVVQLIESNLVTPMIERRTVELPPALTIVVQLVLGVLFGALGLIFASPILAVVVVLIQMLYVQDILGDKNTELNEKQKPGDAADNDIAEPENAS